MSAWSNISNFMATHPLTRDAQLSAWTRFVVWQAKARLRDEWIVPWIEGQKLAVRRGMVGATGNIYAGLHEFEDMMVPLHFLREGDLFLDIGANIGSFTVLAAGVSEARAWAFEPAPETVRYLERNVEVNNLQGRVKVFPLALGQGPGEVAFTLGRDSMNQVVSGATAGSHVRMVPQMALDEVVRDEQPVMIKLDVEGYEGPVLAGAEATLAKPFLRVIELETMSPGIQATLARHGFQKAFYDPFTRRLATEPFSKTASNALYVRDWDFVAKRLQSARKISILGRQV